MNVILVLDNIRSTGNVGSILRTADGFGVSKVVFSGVTPRVDDERLLPHLREKINKQIEKTALGAEKYVEKYACDDKFFELKDLKEKGYTIVGLENNICSKKLIPLCSSNFYNISERIGEKVVIVLGEEVGGIKNSLYDIIDLFLEIPMEGKKESFNVSIATGIVLFALREIFELSCKS
ncbi:TrmH family RNA methyltransferase [Candidatus Saccharibacteria bacterium]|nr:TrmH family RNA methyltransferase [Candidatus Saccharibacteria bacterium]